MTRPSMGVGGAVLCEICRRERASRRCKMCGRAVCSGDFDEGRGICILCRDSLCAVCGKQLAVASCEVCGRPICDACSVEITPVVRLCPDCARRIGGRWPPLELVEAELARLREALARLMFVPRPRGR